MAVTIKLPTPLRRHVGQARTVELEAGCVGDALHRLVSLYPGMGETLYDGDGALKPFVRIFVGDRDIDDLQGVDTPLGGGEVVSIVPPVAGA